MITRIDVGYACKWWVRVVGADACPVNKFVALVHQRGDGVPPPTLVQAGAWMGVHLRFCHNLCSVPFRATLPNPIFLPNFFGGEARRGQHGVRHEQQCLTATTTTRTR